MHETKKIRKFIQLLENFENESESNVEVLIEKDSNSYAVKCINKIYNENVFYKNGVTILNKEKEIKLYLYTTLYELYDFIFTHVKINLTY